MISSNTYEELFEILSYMDKKQVMQIPIDVLNRIKEGRNSDYKTKINKYDLFNKNNISDETMSMICWLDYKYWMDDSQKNEIKQLILNENQKLNIEKRSKYNPDNLFNNSPNNNMNKSESNSIFMMVEHKESFFTKVINKIKNFLNR